jgi:hypothetical protein
LHTKQELSSKTSRNQNDKLFINPLKQNKDLSFLDHQSSQEFKQLIISVRQKKNRNSAISSGLVKTAAPDLKAES